MTWWVLAEVAWLLFLGVLATVALRRRGSGGLACPRCGGLGRVRQAGYSDALYVRCPTCDGTGLVA